MRTIRWGIIGCGDVTEVKSGPGFQKAEHSQLVAVMRRTGHLAQDYAQRHGVPKWYDDAQALIDDPEVDAVYIATPPASHKEYVLRCAQAGKPVYVEKPMAMNHAECLEMINACEQSGTPLFVAYYRRAMPRFLKIRQLLDSGAIGDVRFVRMTLYRPPCAADHNPAENWRIDPAIAGGGYFHDIGSHMLDFFDYALGPIRCVGGFAGNQAGLYKAEDMVCASFQFESGVQGAGLWCFSAFDSQDEVVIMGSQGKLRFGFYDNSPIELITPEGTQSFVIDNPEHVHQPLIQTIVNELNGVADCPSRGQSAARTSWVMDQVVQGFYR